MSVACDTIACPAQWLNDLFVFKCWIEILTSRFNGLIKLCLLNCKYIPSYLIRENIFNRMCIIYSWFLQWCSMICCFEYEHTGKDPWWQSLFTGTRDFPMTRMHLQWGSYWQRFILCYFKISREPKQFSFGWNKKGLYKRWVYYACCCQFT